MSERVKADCESCGATGIYKGFAEGQGVGVVCSSCDGTGCKEIKYTPFKSRKEKIGVSVVFRRNMGRGLGKDSFGGLKYGMWLKGEPFPKGEDRELYCPAWWYQNMDYKKKPEWSECNDTLGRSFSECPHYKNKGKCWERFDREKR